MYDSRWEGLEREEGRYLSGTGPGGGGEELGVRNLGIRAMRSP